MQRSQNYAKKLTLNLKKKKHLPVFFYPLSFPDKILCTIIATSRNNSVEILQKKRKLLKEKAKN